MNQISHGSFSKNPINENYINCIDANRQLLYVHMTIVLIMTITYSTLYATLTLSTFYHWMSIVMMIVGLTYILFSGIHILYAISKWNSRINDGFSRFREACVSLSIKNYRLMKEYREVYHFHYGDILGRCSDKYKNGELKHIDANKLSNDLDAALKDYVRFVLQNDSIEKLESYEWIRTIIEKTIHRYIKLCYYLSFLKPSDKLDINQNIIYVNIESDSILNKRNRKLETIINGIPLEYKHELVGAWNAIDKKHSCNAIINIPYKWIVYEYRNMFRYLYSAKYFKLIHSSFEKDYIDIENHIDKISRSIQQLFYENQLPIPFTQLYEMISDMTLFIFDNFVAIHLISCIFTTGAIVIPIVISIALLCIIVCMVASITSLTKDIKQSIDNTDSLDKLDGKIEAVFDEMNAMLIDGKIKR